MQGIKNIIFDLGGVILNLDNDRTEQAFMAMGVNHFRGYFGLGYAAGFFKDYEIGKISDREFIDALKTLTHSGSSGGTASGAAPSGVSPFNKSISDETVVNGWNALLLDFPAERIALLKNLRQRYRLFLFSNTNALHLDAFKKTYREAFGGEELDDHFERAYYSHLLHMRKPDTQPFEHILRENNLIAAETLFVDDALVNVEGAIAAGLVGLHLKPGMTIMDVKF
jgi:HAD superfamily hydrolase (TIGR01509 family)